MEISRPGFERCEWNIQYKWINQNLFQILLVYQSDYPIIAYKIGKSLKTAYTDVLQLLGHQGGETIVKTPKQSCPSHVGNYIFLFALHEYFLNITKPCFIHHMLAYIYMTSAQIL